MANRHYIPKLKVRVHIEMTDGAQLGGHFFVPANIRVLDIMNDPSYFIPFLRDDGYVVMLNKFEISRMLPYDQKS